MAGKEISLWEKEALIEQDRHDLISASYGSMTVNELFDFYVKMKQKRGKITARTIENYTKVWNKNMRKRNFAGMSIQAVRKTHILDCYQEMMEGGVGNGSITLMHKVLSAMDQRTLQEIMGHSSLAITMKVYNHAGDKCMWDEIEKLDEKRSRDSRAS